LEEPATNKGGDNLKDTEDRFVLKGIFECGVRKKESRGAGRNRYDLGKVIRNP